MNDKTCAADLDPALLARIIGLQTEIVKIGPDLFGVMDFVTEQVQLLTGAGGAILELVEGEEMVYRACCGITRTLLGLRLKRASSLSGLCVESGQVLCCEDAETDPRVDKAACRKVGLRSMVVAPLFHKGTTVGVLKIVSAQPGFFTGQHLCVLKTMSDLIASSMFYSASHEAGELYHQATHDVLTGLANRALFYDRLRSCLAQAKRQSAAVAILNLDMDGLKLINDRFGHRAGDAAIREIADRIRSQARDSDTVARLGGDEFGVILAQVHDREGAMASAARIAREIRRPFVFEGHDLNLDASMGVAMYTEDAVDMEELLEKADQSMYRMKRIRKAEAGETQV